MKKLICIHLVAVPFSIIVIGDVPYTGAKYPCVPTPYLTGSVEPTIISLPILSSKDI